MMAKFVPDRRRWAALIRRVARATKRTDDAEDLLHSAWVRVQQAQAQAQRPIDNPEAYLVRAAVNIGLNEDRRVRRAPFSEGVDLDELLVIDDGPLQDEVLAARQRLERAREGLDRLAPRTREVFILARLEGLKGREIAEKLGISQSAVEKHMAKATLFLAEWMDRQ